MTHPKKTLTEYEKAKALWYKKLRQSGFNDIEQDEDRLKSWSYKIVGDRPGGVIKTTEAYYYIATHFLNSHTFETELEKTIWAYHVEGMSARNISKTLAKVKIKLCKSAVWNSIKKNSKIMYAAYLSSDENE